MRIDLQSNLIGIRNRIEQAAKRASRSADEITIVAVSKTHPTKVIKKALAAGLTVFGENKVQEAEAKIAEVERAAAEWHLIGHLQSNKARKAVKLFDVIHTLDSVELADRLERACVDEGREKLIVFVQIDVAREAGKSGITEPELPVLIEFLRRCKRLRFNGLMILPPLVDEPGASRPYFKRLRQIRDRLASENAFASRRGELSMGMSNDFEVAIEEGATIVRIGTAIFGERK